MPYGVYFRGTKEFIADNPNTWRPVQVVDNIGFLPVVAKALGHAGRALYNTYTSSGYSAKRPRVESLEYSLKKY